jgi:DNA-binding NarL/FixJ family response regulator
VTRVFILSDSSLFSQGVEALLRQETHFEIVGHEADMEKALEGIRTLDAEVVIVGNNDAGCEPGPVAARLLSQGLGAKVIGLSLQESAACVYRGERREVRSLADLVAAIEEPLAGHSHEQG